MNSSTVNTTNYMVPSNGTTHGVLIDATFSAAPYLIDWRQFSVDQFKFQPQGVYIDNTDGTGALVVSVLPFNWRVTCGAGQQLAASFPAPNGQTIEVTGLGHARLIFVDYPVLPSAQAVTLSGTAGVTIEGITTVNPLFTIPSPLSQGLPYRSQEYVIAGECHQGQITGAATNVVITPTAQTNLRKLQITLTADAAMAAAGNNTLTATLNGAVVFKRAFYLPAASVAAPFGGVTLCDLDADMIGLSVGAGNLTVTLTTALSSGTLDVNSIFSAQ